MDTKKEARQQVQNFIDEVEEVRKEKGLNISEFSMLAFGSESQYGKMKSMKFIPSTETLNKMAVALGRHVIICLSED